MIKIDQKANLYILKKQTVTEKELSFLTVPFLYIFYIMS